MKSCVHDNHAEFREERNGLEVDFEARLKELDEKHQHELQELENVYQQQIMGEVERYQVRRRFRTSLKPPNSGVLIF